MTLLQEPPSVRIGNQRPRLSVLPKARAGSAGPDAIEFAESLGYVLDDWQKWLIDGMLSEDEFMQLVATVICIIISRQNGKNVVLEVVELYAFYVLEWDLILHTAHLVTTAAGHMASMLAVVEANPALDEITKVYQANGKERFHRLDNGADLYFVTRGKKAGRGPSPKMVVFDEALYVTDDQIKALIPSMSAQSMNDDPPLMIYTSSAPLADSLVLHRVRNRFIAMAIDGFFAEWSIDATDDEEHPIDHTDVDLWFESNPAMGIRIDPDWVINNELALMSRQDFMGERLGVAIGGGDEAGAGAISEADWLAAQDLSSEIEDGQPSALALAVGPGGVWAAFSEAGMRADDKIHIEFITREPGTAWVAQKALELTTRLGCSLVIDPKSPTKGIRQALIKAGVPLIEVSLEEYMEYCGAFQIDIMARKIKHMNQAPLNAAVAGAEVRPIGESWVWSQKSSEVDITTLVACTLAAGVVRAGIEDDGDLWFALS